MRNSESDDRVSIIKNNISSLFDIIEIFESADFTERELFEIFSRFQIIELMVLKKWYSYNTDNEMISKELNSFIRTKSYKEQKLINSNYENIVFTIT